MVTYKLWLEVERIDERADTYERIPDLEPLEMGEFKGHGAKQRAMKEAIRIHQAFYPDCNGPECDGKPEQILTYAQRHQIHELLWDSLQKINGDTGKRQTGWGGKSIQGLCASIENIVFSHD